MAGSVFGQTKEMVKCLIWNTESFCTLPDSVNVPGAVHYSNTTAYGISCKDLDKGDFVGIWVTFQGKDVKELNMTGHYDNISLINKETGEVSHPVAYMERHKPILEEGNPVYLSNETNIGQSRYVLIPKEKYDLFIIFETAEIGDKLIIENFLEIEIE